MGWKGWKRCVRGHKSILTLRTRHLFVTCIEKYVDDVKQGEKDNPDFVITMMRPTCHVKEETNKNNFLDSFKGYNSLLNSLGLKVEPYWVLPSHIQAHYSAKLNDDISLKWFFENFDKKFSVDSKFISSFFFSDLTIASFFSRDFCN